MAALEQVTQLKGQGMSDEDIVANLQQQGLSPKEITDAINQANIKSAVTGEAGAGYPAPEGPPANPEAGGAPGAVGAGGYAPATEEMAAAPAADAGYAAGGEAAYYPAEGGGGYAASGADSGTMIDIANQVFSEKGKKIQDQVDDLNDFKTTAGTKVDAMDDRLKKIEKMIDTLQIKVLEKVSAFGKDIESTKKEVAMVEESVGKLTGRMAAKKTEKPAAAKGKAKKASKKKK
jgi:hypothetical protein